ncbi:MAG: hypothetical protein QM783_10090 [Phycisphaerales bacterium]
MAHAYDKAKYHDETVQGHGLPEEHASNHIVYFLRWLIDRRLTSDLLETESDGLVDSVRRGDNTIHDLFNHWDRCLVDDMLSDEGNAFAMVYFDYEKGDYLKDYEKLLKPRYEDVYFAPYSDETYRQFAAVIDGRYRAWKGK